MRGSAFLPRSRSKIVFVLAAASYSVAATGLLRAIARIFGAHAAPRGFFLERGYPLLDALDLVLLAPLIETLVLIGIIELVRLLRAPEWLQLCTAATISAGLHFPLSRALVVSPAWFIMAAAYLRWRKLSWKEGFGVVGSIHALINLYPAISAIGYAFRQDG